MFKEESKKVQYAFSGEIHSYRYFGMFLTVVLFIFMFVDIERIWLYFLLVFPIYYYTASMQGYGNKICVYLKPKEIAIRDKPNMALLNISYKRIISVDLKPSISLCIHYKGMNEKGHIQATSIKLGSKLLNSAAMRGITQHLEDEIEKNKKKRKKYKSKS